MRASQGLALALVVSVGLNVFLGSALASKMLAGPAEDHQPAEAQTGATRQLAPKQSAQRRPKDNKNKPRRGARPDHHNGDLAMLRKMVRVMGGPSDPRIQKIRQSRSPEMRKMKASMRKAHRQVEEALSADELNQDELAAALKHLRKTSFSAQALAQEGIVELASLMTDEERERLKSEASPNQRQKKVRAASPRPE